jgi:hypothetical protein
LVQVDARGRILNAEIVEVNVDEAEIEAFRDKVKIIPSGSRLVNQPVKEKAPVDDEHNNLPDWLRDAEASGDTIPDFMREPKSPKIEPESLPENRPVPEPEKYSDDWRTIKPLGPITDSRTPAEKDEDEAPPQQAMFTDGADPDVTRVPTLYQSGPGTAVIRIDPVNDAVVVRIIEQAHRLREIALKRVITTDADLTPATEDLSVIARVKKELETLKANYTKPIRAHLADVTSAFASITAPLEAADKVTRSQVLAYTAEQKRRATEAAEITRQKEELARREAALNHGEFTVDTTPVQAPAPVRRVSMSIGFVMTKKNRTWRLVDFKTVPDEYKQLDTGKISRVVKSGGAIDGIQVEEEDILQVNTR